MWPATAPTARAQQCGAQCRRGVNWTQSRLLLGRSSCRSNFISNFIKVKYSPQHTLNMQQHTTSIQLEAYECSYLYSRKGCRMWAVVVSRFSPTVFESVNCSVCATLALVIDTRDRKSTSLSSVARPASCSPPPRSVANRSDPQRSAANHRVHLPDTALLAKFLEYPLRCSAWVASSV